MTISRRGALLGAPAAVAVCGMPAGAHTVDPMVAAVDPIFVLEQEWLAQRELLRASPDRSDRALNPHFRRLEEIEWRMYRTPARSLLGVVVKLRIWHRFYAEFSGVDADAMWWRGDLARLSFGELGFACVMRDLEHLAGEARS